MTRLAGGWSQNSGMEDPSVEQMRKYCIKTNGRTFTLTVARVYDDPPRVAHPFQSRIL